MKENHAEIHFSKEGSAPRVELVLPHGTKLESLLKMQALISRDVISKISPRGCQACLSGVHFNIRERLENVLLVNLETMKYV